MSSINVPRLFLSSRSTASFRCCIVLSLVHDVSPHMVARKNYKVCSHGRSPVFHHQANAAGTLTQDAALPLPQRRALARRKRDSCTASPTVLKPVFLQDTSPCPRASHTLPDPSLATTPRRLHAPSPERDNNTEIHNRHGMQRRHLADQSSRGRLHARSLAIAEAAARGPSDCNFTNPNSTSLPRPDSRQEENSSNSTHFSSRPS
ncbi:hypothetical protein BU16DRAFT_396393 [Lophium mytilinum]|uniref:Uncharacterized protein n=1 Tax=Lophium mytilinum TaxID=390894 RepID=A0A6A6QXA4_9PEZI|nr:hypothetical protein BU16DRAFT_396393 [Lophium mytilinum]